MIGCFVCWIIVLKEFQSEFFCYGKSKDPSACHFCCCFCRFWFEFVDSIDFLSKLMEIDIHIAESGSCEKKKQSIRCEQYPHVRPLSSKCYDRPQSRYKVCLVTTMGTPSVSPVVSHYP